MRHREASRFSEGSRHKIFTPKKTKRARQQTCGKKKCKSALRSLRNKEYLESLSGPHPVQKFFFDRMVLKRLYIDDSMIRRDIAHLYGCSVPTICLALHRYGIRKKGGNDAKTIN